MYLNNCFILHIQTFYFAAGETEMLRSFYIFLGCGVEQSEELYFWTQMEA